MDGDFFIGAALSATLTKLVLRYADLELDVVRGTYAFNVDFLSHLYLLFDFSVPKIV